MLGACFLIIVYSFLVFRNKPHHQVDHDGKYQADHQAGNYGEEKAEIALFDKNVAGQASQPWNLTPEDEQHSQDDDRDAQEYQQFSQGFKIRHLYSRFF